jgi:hypothetical protein
LAKENEIRFEPAIFSRPARLSAIAFGWEKAMQNGAGSANGTYEARRIFVESEIQNDGVQRRRILHPCNR